LMVGISIPSSAGRRNFAVRRQFCYPKRRQWLASADKNRGFYV
jgi:hypothetical protein